MSIAEATGSLLELANRIPPSRILTVRGNLSNDIAAHVKRKLAEMQREEGNILFVADSIGGHFSAGIALYDSFRTSSQMVIGKVEGIAASAAFMALQGCGIKLATANSILVIHDTGSQDPEPFFVRHTTTRGEFMRYHADIFNTLSEKVYRNHETTLDILRAVSSFKHKGKEVLEQFLDTEHRMTPEEAISYGFLDGII